MTKAMPGSDECLRGKVAVVTGAARGIGRATAIAFARAGANIIGLDICAPVDPRSGVAPSTPEDLEETGRLVQTEGCRGLGSKVLAKPLPTASFMSFAGNADIRRSFCLHILGSQPLGFSI
jgi:NAD(P)-dependent dehydrogenase (short-subunit alcohol dehydrogenase family)